MLRPVVIPQSPECPCRKELSRFLEDFGQKQGLEWFVEGLTFQQAEQRFSQRDEFRGQLGQFLEAFGPEAGLTYFQAGLSLSAARNRHEVAEAMKTLCQERLNWR